MEKIYNLTQHDPSQDQISIGVVNLPTEIQSKIRELITFSSIPSKEEMKKKAEKIICLLQLNVPEYSTVMIGGAPFFQGTLERILKAYGYKPLHSFSQRKSIEKIDENGNITKVSVFVFEGFVEV